MTLVGALYLGMTVLLVLSGVALIAPAVRGIQVVVYRRATFALGLSTLVFVTGWLVNFALYSPDGSLPVIGWYIYVVSGFAHLYAVWLFARDFINFEQDSGISMTVEHNIGGFDIDDRE